MSGKIRGWGAWLRNQPVSFFVLAAVVAIAVVLNLSGYVSVSRERAALNIEAANNDAKARDLQSELARLSADMPSESDATLMSTALYSAASAGEAVADYQSYYYEITSTMSASPENATTYVDRMQANAAAIGAYFDESSQNAKTPWFGEEGFTWKFRTTYEFATKEVRCLWTCEDEAGALGAFTTATYVVDDGLFKDAKTVITVYGEKRSERAVSDYARFIEGEDGQLLAPPEGSHFVLGLDENGNVIDPDGTQHAMKPNREMTDEERAEWESDMASMFADAKAYREEMLKAQSEVGVE